MSTTEKRVLEETKSMTELPVVILDIEGTTTSISFVKDTLFPYVRTNLEKYVKKHWTEDEFKSVLEQLITQAEKDVEEKVEGVVALDKAEEDAEKAQKALVANVLWQMDSDRKTAALKLLQGHVYREGYKNGDLKGHVFEDVVPALKKWKEGDKKVYIYSSGSVEAQKLLFGYTTEGDLLEYLAGHFDTEVGAKGDVKSYKNIAEKIGKKTEEMVFYTDILKEAEAAKEAGMTAVLMQREGNAELSKEAKEIFNVLTTLLEEEDTEEQSPAKKVKMDVVPDVEMEELADKKEEAVAEVTEKKEEESKPEEAKEKKADEPEVKATEEEPKSETVEDKVEAVEAPPKVEAVEAPPKVEALEAPPKVEALEAPPKVDAIEHKPESNGTHENGVNGTSNGESHKTNGTNGVSESNGKEEKEEAVVKSPSKKVVTDAAGDAPEVAATE